MTLDLAGDTAGVTADALLPAAGPVHRVLLEELSGAAVKNPILGFICVLAATCTSGYAGVYFEMILKGAKTSLWIRNIQMGLPSIVFALVSAYTKDLSAVREKGFFHGYTALVWGVILLQAVGGLVVAVVVRYADNILKAFASAVSIVMSCLLSAVLFSFHPTPAFMVGTLLVSVAVFLYSKPAPPDSREPMAPAPSRQGSLPLFDRHDRSSH